MDTGNCMHDVSQRIDPPAPASVPAESGTPRARSIVRGGGGGSLTTGQLEERRLIHRSESMREQADAFRELRTRLLALGGDRNFVTLVAPVRYGCGGSFVARNLAAAFAFDESKTALLIDCDARHPSQDAAMRVDVSSGSLMAYLDDAGSDLADAIYETGVNRLQLIPVGRRREISGEAFTSFRMRAMVDSLRSRHADRYLILDAPPVAGGPDARILSDLADVVVLVAGYARVTPEDIDKAVAAFPPGKVAGVVFNERP
jgi:protein-tyrosine kinase